MTWSVLYYENGSGRQKCPMGLTLNIEHSTLGDSYIVHRNNLKLWIDIHVLQAVYPGSFLINVRWPPNSEKRYKDF